MAVPGPGSVRSAEGCYWQQQVGLVKQAREPLWQSQGCRRAHLEGVGEGLVEPASHDAVRHAPRVERRAVFAHPGLCGKADIRLPVKGNSNSHGARPVY